MVICNFALALKVGTHYSFCAHRIYKFCHPQYTTVLTTDYEYGTEKFFFVRILRHHKSHPESSTLIGSALFEIGDILSSPTHTKVKRLRNGGCLFCQLEFVKQEQQDERILQIQLRAMELLRRSSIPWKNSPDTVIQLEKQRVSSTGNSWVAVYRSGPVYNSVEPTWDESSINIGSLCYGDLVRHAY